MTSKIKFQIEVSRVLEVLSTQIYESPYALLRENAQNAFDAILLRKHVSPAQFNPEILIDITESMIKIVDNGIGMNQEQLKNNFWRAGSSGKNTPEAREAGVVGTFGIGALANFGICKRLTVVSESLDGKQRTKCIADRDTLSLDEDCIVMEDQTPVGNSGTTILAELPEGSKISVKEAENYLETFTKHVQVPIKLNGRIISMKPLEESVPADKGGWSTTLKNCQGSGGITCDLEVRVSEGGIAWLRASNIGQNGSILDGEMLLRQGEGQIMALRSGFGLSRAAVSSYYSFGGVANMKALQPTAGREALTTASIQMLQSIVAAIEHIIGPVISECPYVDMNTSFMSWALRNNRFDLCGNLKVTLLPHNDRLELKEVASKSKKVPMNYYDGMDEKLAKTYASDETQLIRISRSNPRGQCEEAYLTRYANVTKISNDPKVIKIIQEASWSLAQAALAFKLPLVLESDYFVRARIQFGEITHNLPMFIEEGKTPLVITLAPDHSAVTMLLQCYATDLDTFGAFVKDFARSLIFPQISHLVPSSTRQGAEAFLKMLRKQREVFEYDQSEMQALDEIMAEFAEGTVKFDKVLDAALASAQKQQQVVSSQDIRPATAVIRDVVESQQILETAAETSQVAPTGTFAAKPAISRSDINTDAKILVLEGSRTLFGFKALLRLSDRAYRDRGEFFFQPHSTEIIWGGQRVIFIFHHASGAFGFYYDIQLNELLSIPPGGSSFETMTIAVNNAIFIPIPEDLSQHFIPQGDEKKRFDVRYDILYPQ